MEADPLLSINPADGRYAAKTRELAPYFSEYALIRYRIQVEVAYLKALSALPLPGLESFEAAHGHELQALLQDFSPEHARRVKEIEAETNHDVKAVEYYLKEYMDKSGMKAFREFVHFGLTSQDVNNTAIPLMMKDGTEQVLMPAFEKLLNSLDEMVEKWWDVPMLARTHGQPASPTRLGKEIDVFASRLREQFKMLKDLPFAAKFGGATGNMNAHYVAYPSIKWDVFAKDFLEKQLGLKRSYPTTQIEHYDYTAAYFDNIRRINTILIDLSRDMWSYISMDYFKQEIRKNEVGSSAMPHKVNPIDFENAEGNLGMSNAICSHLSRELPVSRLQRDLTDSTVTRNVGMPLAYSLIAVKSLLKGLGKLLINRSKIDKDLNENWAVVAEAIQTVLRRENYPAPYEALKKLTRTNEKINKDSIQQFIDSLDVSENVKKELREITPFNYIGL